MAKFGKRTLSRVLLACIVTLFYGSGTFACTLVADSNEVIVTGLPSGSTDGQLCRRVTKVWTCEPVQVSQHGIIEAPSSDSISGLIWFTPVIHLSKGKDKFVEGCGAVVPASKPDEPSAWIVTLITSTIGMLSGFGLAWFTFALTRAARNKELANDWIEEYFWRLRQFEASGALNIQPKAIPHLPISHRRRLLSACKSIDAILNEAGVLTERNGQERKEITVRIAEILEKIEPKSLRGRLGAAIAGAD